MLEIKIPLTPEGWDEEKEEFVDPVTFTLQLEHSLISISKWESKWCKPFLTDDEKTAEETLDYIKQMTLTPNVDPLVYEKLTADNILDINNYIGAPMTATTFSTPKKGGTGGEQITSELIYYWMIALNIPDRFESWHLNRLITLIEVCNIKNQPPKKMSRSEALSRQRAANAARRKKLNSKG